MDAARLWFRARVVFVPDTFADRHFRRPDTFADLSLTDLKEKAQR